MDTIVCEVGLWYVHVNTQLSRGLFPSLLMVMIIDGGVEVVEWYTLIYEVVVVYMDALVCEVGLCMLTLTRLSRGLCPSLLMVVSKWWNGTRSS